jgi:hypothetical protein
MAFINREFVGPVELYIQGTYVEQFCEVSLGKCVLIYKDNSYGIKKAIY